MRASWLSSSDRAISILFLLIAAAIPLGAGHASTASANRPTTIAHPDVRAVRDQIAPLILAAQKRFRVPGISLVLIRGDGILWMEGFGHADRERNISADSRTVYRVGSLAKPLTAIAAMQLAERGLIDIDQPLKRYLPELNIRSRFGASADPLTVRSVLSHHSGLPTDLNKGMWTKTSFTRVASQLREEYAAFPPNLVFSYSNVGYSLIGHMIERVSGRPYEDYMEERVLRPLGMLDTGFESTPTRQPRLARGYRNGKPFRLLPIRDTPALGLYTSAADLGRLIEAILSPGNRTGSRLLDTQTLRKIFAPQNLDVPLDLDVINGLGWFIEDGTIPGGGRVLRHGGTTLSFASELALLPERGLGVAVLANADGSREIVASLAEAILTSVLEAMPRQPSTKRFLADLAKRRVKPERAALSGNYATDFGLISIHAKGPTLYASLLKKSFDLIPYPNGWYGLGGGALSTLPSALKPLATLKFQTQRIDDREVVVGKKGGKRVLVGEKVPDAPVPRSWLKRIGRYKILNQDKDFPLTGAELKMCEKYLCMSYRLPVLSPETVQVPLRPISDTEAILLGLGRTRGETLRVLRVGGEERLRYSGFVGRKL